MQKKFDNHSAKQNISKNHINQAKQKRLDQRRQKIWNNIESKKKSLIGQVHQLEKKRKAAEKLISQHTANLKETKKAENINDFLTKGISQGNLEEFTEIIIDLDKHQKKVTSEFENLKTEVRAYKPPDNETNFMELAHDIDKVGGIILANVLIINEIKEKLSKNRKLKREKVIENKNNHSKNKDYLKENLKRAKNKKKDLNEFFTRKR